MGEKEQDQLIRAYVTLRALRKNIDQIGAIPEKHVYEFHRVLDKMESIGVDTSEFRILESEIKPKITQTSFMGAGAEHSYSKEKYVDRAYMLTKMDAILGYLESITSEKPRRIGFSPPDNR